MADWGELGLLDGLEGEARAERAELLDWLAARGHTVDELRGSDFPALLPAEHAVMGGPPTLTPREGAERGGADLELIARIRRVLGLPPVAPDERTVSELEAVAFALPSAFSDFGFDEDQMLVILRVLGRGLGQAAQVMRGATMDVVADAAATERELAERYGSTVEAIMPAIGPLLDVLLRLQLRHLVQIEGFDLLERRAGGVPGSREVAVCFADLVGFTRLGESIDAAELGTVADRLGELATEVAEAPVSFVKQLGDGVMLVSGEPAALMETTFELVERIEADPGLPQVRAGIAFGPAARRAGDWYGRSINLASRVGGIARAGTVLVTDDAKAAMGEDAADWSFAGARAVKGVKGDVRVHRARRPTG